MINKLTKFFAASQEAAVKIPEPQIESPMSEAQTETAAVQDNPQQPLAAENISLLKLCDAKLNKLAKFFSGAYAAPPDVTAKIAAQETDDSSSQPSVIPPEIQTAPSITQEPQSGTQTDAEDLPATPQPPVSQQSWTSANTGEAAPDTGHNRDLKIEERLPTLQQQLEQHIREVKNAETELSAFRDELQQQLADHRTAVEQQLLEHNNTLEVTLKNAFKKISDHQSVLENKYNQQIDLIRQVLGTNQGNIAEAADKLDNMAEQNRQLQENLQQLNKTIEAYKTQVDIDSITARLSALENPTKRKSKSWFRK